MDVDRFKERLALEPVVRDVLDLPLELRREVAGDIALRRLVDERIRIDRALDRLPELPSSDEAIARVLAAVSADSDPRRGRRPFRPAWWLAAAALVAVAIGVGRARLSGTGSTGGDGAANDELLAQMDLLMDWDVLDSHAEELDAIAFADLAAAIAEFDGVAPLADDKEIPR